jgi:uncharacterized cupin superfamily protein
MHLKSDEGKAVTKPLINLDEITIEERPQFLQPGGDAASRFHARVGQVASRIGARLLGYNITAVPPGKRAFPLHNHHANEELFFILQGSGELRVGDERWTIRQGDFIASPPGGPEHAHQIINTGSDELRYLAVSTMITPEVLEYPDSGKLALISRQPAADGSQRVVRHVGRAGAGLDYWDGE